MDEILKERAQILEKILPLLFKGEDLPKQGLIKSILIHQSFASNPTKISSAKSIKVDVDPVFAKFGPQLEIQTKTVGYTCPFTQTRVVNPWKGECGHTFEESVVLSFISQGRNRCPINGCGKVLTRKQ